MTMMMTKTTIDKNGLEGLLKSGPEWLKNKRKQAWEIYSELPFPNHRDEGWRRTDPERVNPADHSTLAPKSEFGFLGEELKLDGVEFLPLDQAVEKHALLEQHLGALVPAEGRKFTSLNEALWSGGSFVKIDADTSTGASALHAKHHFTTGEQTAALTHSVILAGRHSKATVIESFSSDDGALLASPSVEIEVEEGATLQYVFVHQFGKATSAVPTVHAKIAKDAHLQVLFVGFGGRLAKVIVESDLEGEGCKSEVLGIVMGEKRQHFDIDVVQNHRVGNNISDVLCHIALTDRARSVFSGNVNCEPGSQKIDGYQQNRNLMLSEKARADSMPKLEIEANDVRCTHGATFTTYDQNQRFYLESRGLNRFEAERLLVTGFFQEVINRLDHEAVVEHLAEMLTEKMESALGRA